MRTKITTVEQAHRLIIEEWINKSNGALTKVSDESILGGAAYGIAKVFQKAQKDIALIETLLFPDFADGSGLDKIANDHGIPSRFGAIGSSTYVRLTADPGTIYVKTVNTISGQHGLTFTMEEDVTVGDDGFAFVKVSSVDVGAKTNIEANSLTQLSSAPPTHKGVTNDFRATGGRDLETDIPFRNRIKEGANIIATKTLSFLDQLFLRINPKILRTLFQGTEKGKAVIGIVTQNGADLTQEEIDELILVGGEALAISDLKDFDNQGVGIVIKNIEWYPIDLDFYVTIDQSFVGDDIRKSIQIQIANYLDPRNWVEGETVQWDIIFNIVKNLTPVKYLPNKLFTINGGTSSLKIPKTQIPRMRGFIMRDEQGNIISNSDNTLQNIAFPLSPNDRLQNTLLNNINI
jgi:hypothetical protein